MSAMKRTSELVRRECTRRGRRGKHWRRCRFRLHGGTELASAAGKVQGYGASEGARVEVNSNRNSKVAEEGLHRVRIAADVSGGALRRIGSCPCPEAAETVNCKGTGLDHVR